MLDGLTACLVAERLSICLGLCPSCVRTLLWLAHVGAICAATRVELSGDEEEEEDDFFLLR